MRKKNSKLYPTNWTKPSLKCLAIKIFILFSTLKPSPYVWGWFPLNKFGIFYTLDVSLSKCIDSLLKDSIHQSFCANCRYFQKSTHGDATFPFLHFLSYIMAMILVVSILPRKKVQTVVRFIFIYCRLFIGYLELAGWLGHGSFHPEQDRYNVKL